MWLHSNAATTASISDAISGHSTAATFAHDDSAAGNPDSNRVAANSDLHSDADGEYSAPRPFADPNSAGVDSASADNASANINAAAHDQTKKAQTDANAGHN